MDFSAQFIGYNQTGYFGRLITDYISGENSLKDFYEHPASLNGIKGSIAEKKKSSIDRKLLVTELKKQYVSVSFNKKTAENIESLLSENTFTICTAHQPNIFTGHLYFIYKIIHAIKLSDFLNEQLPAYKFVPVYYMGSEDADLGELGEININGEKYKWDTNQTGAVGRMKVDAALLKLIDTIEGQLLIYPFGKEIISLIKNCYKENVTIEQATFQLVNELFNEYGLIILLPDNAALKKSFAPVIDKELKEMFSHKAVEETAAKFPSVYKLQASGRELNLFYLKDDIRERIEKTASGYKIHNSKIQFDEKSIEKELNEHPERFSPNVILRPIFQEFILPNIAFIGGGGEIAYWLELKKVFTSVNMLFPLLIVRNSFMIVPKEIKSIIDKLQLDIPSLFKTESQLLSELVKRDSSAQLTLEKEKQQLITLYAQMKTIAGNVDITLKKHTETLQAKALKKIGGLEKKIFKAEKKKFEAQQRQLHKVKLRLFPNGSLQERVDNVLPYYAKWGNDFIKSIYACSLTLEQQFTILIEEV